MPTEINGDGTGPGWVNPDTGQPITTSRWVDRLAPKAAAVVALDLRDLRRDTGDEE
jgi:hypothetical protein